jgi:hypothetical protein
MNNTKKYKYLVVNGCSQTSGQNCPISETWAVKLANRLGLELINLASAGTGWYKVETSTMSFINGNRDILDECFFILQKSALDRRVNYEEIAVNKSDIWEKWNINYMSQPDLAFQGYIDFEKHGFTKPTYHRLDDVNQQFQLYDGLDDILKTSKLGFFPEHKHYPNSRHFWKLGDNNDIPPPFIHEQFEELMLHWGLRISSLHLFLKNMGIGHLIVDGYSPFLSYKLNFRNYYDSNNEFEFVNKFWSTETDNPDDEMVYDFKNIKCGWIFDTIESKYKIDDVVLWSLYQFKTERLYNADGGHAGPLGMDIIENVIYKNLVEKEWF